MSTRLLCLLCSAFLLSSLALADSITTLDGKTYQDIKVKPERSDVFGIYITHKAGSARIPYADMIPADKAKYGYDSGKEQQAKADIVARQEAERQRKEEQQAAVKAKKEADEKARLEAERQQQESSDKLVRETKRNNARIVNGIIYDFSELERDKLALTDVVSKVKTDESRKAMLSEVDKFVHRWGVFIVSGKVIQVLDDGLLVDCEALFSVYYKRTVFIKLADKKKTVVDGDVRFFYGLPDGRYQYVNTLGATKTVPAFRAAYKPEEPFKDSDIKPLPPVPPAK